MTIGGGSKDAYYRCERAQEARHLRQRDVSPRERAACGPTGRAPAPTRFRPRPPLSYARKRLAERLGELTREKGMEPSTMSAASRQARSSYRPAGRLRCRRTRTAAVAEKLRGLERAADAHGARWLYSRGGPRQPSDFRRLTSSWDCLRAPEASKRRYHPGPRGAPPQFPDGKITMLPHPPASMSLAAKSSQWFYSPPAPPPILRVKKSARDGIQRVVARG